MERGLSAGGAVLGVSIAFGALLAGGLIVWHPLTAVRPLALPVLAGIVVQLVLAGATVVLMVERRGVQSGVVAGVRGVPTAIGDGVRLLTASRVLLALVCVELLWGFGMPAFESLTTVKLADLIRSRDDAAALMGPLTSAAWGVSALGSWAAIAMTHRWGVAGNALFHRIVQGAAVVALGAVAGTAGLITAFLACYLVHGVSNPLHSTLLHRQVGAERRATVVSLNSMVSQGAGAVGTIVLTALADHLSVNTAMYVAGIALALAAPLYLPALRAERQQAAGSGATAQR